MAQQSNQRGAGQTARHTTGEETIAGKPALGKIVSLPFTMEELADIHMSLHTADEREAFWLELSEKMGNFTDEQKALFVISWSESLGECLADADKAIAASFKARIHSI